MTYQVLVRIVTFWIELNFQLLSKNIFHILLIFIGIPDRIVIGRIISTWQLQNTRQPGIFIYLVNNLINILNWTLFRPFTTTYFTKPTPIITPHVKTAVNAREIAKSIVFHSSKFISTYFQIFLFFNFQNHCLYDWGNKPSLHHRKLQLFKVFSIISIPPYLM